MGESLIIRRGGGGKQTAAPSITVVSTSPTGVTFTLTNNDDNTAIVSYGISTTRGAVELAAAATSSNITVDLAAGTYTLTAYATVVGEVATSATASVEITVPQYELLYEETVATAKTQIDITGLNIGKDDGLRLVYTMVGESGTNSIYSLFPNDLTTTSNYWMQEFVGLGNTLFAGRYNTGWFGYATDTEPIAGFADIKVSNNDRFVYQSQKVQRIGAASTTIHNTNLNVVGTQTVSSITKLSLVSNRTNGIAVGSKIALYKVTEAA